MTEAKDLPLFKGIPLPLDFTPRQIREVGSKVFHFIQNGWRFGDAFNHFAHEHCRIYKHDGDGRYESLKKQVHDYCEKIDPYLTQRARNRKRNVCLIIPGPHEPMPRIRKRHGS